MLKSQFTSLSPKVRWVILGGRLCISFAKTKYISHLQGGEVLRRGKTKSTDV